MSKSILGVDREGIPFIALLAFSTLIFSALNCFSLSILFLSLTWFCWFFFRDPERITPTTDHVAISPADGKVILIEPKNNPISHKEELCISIFMNVFNVHINRSPVEGSVESITYIPGAFFNAALDKASTKNERCIYTIKDLEGHTWTAVQIAGLIARRIVSKTQEKDMLQRGERFGIIRFGSRVDLYIPKEYTPAISIGEHVFAGETIIATKEPV